MVDLETENNYFQKGRLRVSFSAEPTHHDGPLIRSYLISGLGAECPKVATGDNRSFVIIYNRKHDVDTNYIQVQTALCSDLS